MIRRPQTHFKNVYRAVEVQQMWDREQIYITVGILMAALSMVQMFMEVEMETALGITVEEI